MNKVDLIQNIAHSLEITQQEAKHVLEVILGGIVRALQKRDRVEVRRFGTFGTHSRKARSGRNPRNGEMVRVPARVVPHFRPSKELTEAVNGYRSSD